MWRCRFIAVALMLASQGGFAPGVFADRPPLPNFGVLNNNDGDFAYPSFDTATNSQTLINRINTLSGTPAKTFMLSIGSGSDILHYPTQVANNFGWRETSLDDDPGWTQRVTNGQHFAEVNYDPLRVIADRVKQLGMYFIPSYRMNDAHFVTQPLDYPLTGEFWINNQDKTIGSSPVQGYDYSNLLDFAHQEVRDFRMAVINESIDRYADVMDGYELDFDRFQIFFAPGEAQANAHLMTDLVRQVRQRLDTVATQTGRPQYLFVRVPPTLANNHWSGLEIEEWITERIVDVVIPSTMQTLAHDMPIQEFVELAEPVGAQVIPGILPRTNYGWDLIPRPEGVGYTGAYNGRVAEAALTRGALSNYRYLGADNFQLYNHSIPWTSGWNSVAQSAAAENPTLGKDRIFAITPAYFNDNENTYEYAKQLPISIPGSQNREVTLLVGDDILQMIKERPHAVVLRFGLTNTNSTAPLTVEINGQQLHTGSIASNYYTLNAISTTDGPTAYFQTNVGNLLMLQQGMNTVKVRNLATSSTVRITDIHLGVFETTVPSPTGPPTVVREPQRGELKQKYYDGQGPNMAFTVTDRTNNGLSAGLGGVFFSGQVAVTTSSYSFATGFVFDQAVYYPSVEGAIESIDYSYYFAKTSGTRPTAFVSLMLMQDGKFFALNNATSFENGVSPSSKTVAQQGVTAEDFWQEMPNSGGLGLNANSHPDFSATGGPIYVGWMLSRSADPTSGGNDQPRTDLDDLVVKFNLLTEPALQGDYNTDGVVDAADYVVWRHKLGSDDPQADGDESGEVNEEDFAVWVRNFGASTNGASMAGPVPELATGQMVLIAMLFAGQRHARPARTEK